MSDTRFITTIIININYENPRLHEIPSLINNYLNLSDRIWNKLTRDQISLWLLEIVCPFIDSQMRTLLDQKEYSKWSDNDGNEVSYSIQWESDVPCIIN